MPSVQPMNTFSKYELMAQDSTAGLTTRKGILHYEPEHSSWHNRQHVHRPVFYVAGTSHTTRNAISTFSLCNHFPAEKKKTEMVPYRTSLPGIHFTRDMFYRLTLKIFFFFKEKLPNDVILTPKATWNCANKPYLNKILDIEGVSKP